MFKGGIYHTTIAKNTLHGLKVLRKYFSVVDNMKFKQMIVSLFYSRLFYGCELWLNNLLPQNILKSIFNLHVSAGRLFLNDPDFQLSKEQVVTSIPFCNPLNWSTYCLAKLTFKLTQEMDLTPIIETLLLTSYTTRREPHRLRFFKSNKRKAGLKSIPNLISQFVTSSLDFDYYDVALNLNQLNKLARSKLLK